MSDDDIQSDIDSAAEHQMTMEEAQRRLQQDPEIAFWAKVHDEAIARHRTEAAKLKALNWALDKLFSK